MHRQQRYMNGRDVQMNSRSHVTGRGGKSLSRLHETRGASAIRYSGRQTWLASTRARATRARAGV